MRQISIYGAGHLTQSLLIGLSQSYPNQLIKVYNRTANRVEELQAIHPLVSSANECKDLCRYSSFVFLIIPPSVITDLNADFVSALPKSDSVLVSCANNVSIDSLSKVYPNTKIVRLLPNINWQMNLGTTIYQANSNVSTHDLTELLDFLSPITTLVEADSDLDFDKLGKLTSCGPGLFSKIVDQLFISFDITDNKQKQAVYHTFKNTMSYLLDSEKSPDKVISEVANKGGLTESGIVAADETLPECFDYISQNMDKRLLEKKQ
jgi:pyrroline-5-carboxylate reductase